MIWYAITFVAGILVGAVTAWLILAALVTTIRKAHNTDG